MWGIQHFQPYVAASRFTIYTDHKPLVGLKNIDPGHDPTGRRARWDVQLSTYDFTIAWKPRRFHGNADGVSRIPNETDGEQDPNCLEDQATIGLVHGKDPEIDVISMQQKDSVLRKVTEWVKEGTPKCCDVESDEKLKKWFGILHELALKNGILCHKWKVDNTTDGIIQIVISEKAMDKIIVSCHDQSGNFGMKKTLSKTEQSTSG